MSLRLVCLDLSTTHAHSFCDLQMTNWTWTRYLLIMKNVSKQLHHNHWRWCKSWMTYILSQLLTEKEKVKHHFVFHQIWFIPTKTAALRSLASDTDTFRSRTPSCKRRPTSPSLSRPPSSASDTNESCHRASTPRKRPASKRSVSWPDSRTWNGTPFSAGLFVVRLISSWTWDPPAASASASTRSPSRCRPSPSFCSSVCCPSTLT